VSACLLGIWLPRGSVLQSISPYFYVLYHTSCRHRTFEISISGVKEIQEDFPPDTESGLVGVVGVV
jgi:hypothetical protein